MTDMAAESAVQTLLSTFTEVSDLVGTRVYPVKLPQDPTYPAVTFFRVSGIRHSVMGNDTGIVEKRIQVSSWDRQYSGANALAEAVRNAMQRFRGVVSGAGVTVGVGYDPLVLVWSGKSVEIIDIFMDGDGPEIWEDGVNVYQFITDFNVIYREAV